MTYRFPLLIILFFAAFIIANDAFFIVDETKQALVLQLGNPKRTIRNAGIYFKVPLLQQVALYEKRVLDVDPRPEDVLLASNNEGMMATLAAPAVEGESDDAASETAKDYSESGSPITVDTFGRYRITDPLKFRQRLGSEQAAELRISNEMESTTRDVLGRSTLEQLLSKDRARIMEQILTRVNQAVSDLGIEMIDVRINRADLTENLEQATFNRMRSEREQRAAEIRSIGEKRALEISSTADRERTVLLATAQRDAQILRGSGDEEASRIYADAYQRDPEFYAFYRSLQAYKQGLARKETTLILSPDSAFFNALKGK
ncbi:MAG: hflC [Alphaproteobacteria bacterium]|nr:hflC [Alphaproteobacteria bacterium]